MPPRRLVELNCPECGTDLLESGIDSETRGFRNAHYREVSATDYPGRERLRFDGRTESEFVPLQESFRCPECGLVMEPNDHARYAGAEENALEAFVDMQANPKSTDSELPNSREREWCRAIRCRGCGQVIAPAGEPDSPARVCECGTDNRTEGWQ